MREQLTSSHVYFKVRFLVEGLTAIIAKEGRGFTTLVFHVSSQVRGILVLFAARRTEKRCRS